MPRNIPYSSFSCNPEKKYLVKQIWVTYQLESSALTSKKVKPLLRPRPNITEKTCPSQRQDENWENACYVLNEKVHGGNIPQKSPIGMPRCSRMEPEETTCYTRRKEEAPDSNVVKMEISEEDTEESFLDMNITWRVLNL